MKNRKINISFIWSGEFILTLILTLNLFVKIQEEKEEFRKNAQILFLEAVQKDTDRRSKEVGGDFRYNYNSAFKKDTITIESIDTIIYIKNNKEAAQKMSDKERMDFGTQLFLAFENPIQPSLLDNQYRALLLKHEIPVQTAVIYSYDNKPVYSCPNSSFYESAEALDEVIFGPIRLIVLQAFVEIPFCYIMRQAVMASGLFVLVWLLALLVALWLTFCKRGRKIYIIPAPEAPKTMIEIMPGLLLDETHGVLQSGDRRVVLINFRLKLFLLLLEHKGYYIETDKLLETIWPDGSVSKDALSSTVKRLKEDLSLFPEITIESGRGKGYVLNIVDEPETSPDSI